MFRIQKGLIKLLGIISIFLYLSNLLDEGLKIIAISVQFLVLLIPFYGLYRAKKGQTVTKGLRYYLQSILKVVKKLFKVRYFNLTGFLITIIVIIALYEVFLYILMYTSVTFILISIVWGAIRYGLRQLKNINILSFMEVIRLAL